MWQGWTWAPLAKTSQSLPCSLLHPLPARQPRLPTVTFPARLRCPSGTTASGRSYALPLQLSNGYQEALLLAAPGGALGCWGGCISLLSNPSSRAHSCRVSNKVGDMLYWALKCLQGKATVYYFFPAISKRKLCRRCEMSSGKSQTVMLSIRPSAALARKELHVLSEICPGT